MVPLAFGGDGDGQGWGRGRAHGGGRGGAGQCVGSVLRKALEKFYPQLREVKLLDYKVRVLAANRGTESKVRVLIESGDHKDK